MLILSRKIGEKIMIGDNIVIEVCEINRERGVYIGIKAPKEMKILREEVIDRYKIQRNDNVGNY